MRYVCSWFMWHWLPSKVVGSLRPWYPITLVLIWFWSSMVKSPFYILFNIFPYPGSSLKQWLLSIMITTLMLLSQSPLDKLEKKSSLSLLQTGSSWQKSPENMIENSPKTWVWIPICLSFLSSLFKTLLLMNDISSIVRICTSCHYFCRPNSVHCSDWWRQPWRL